MAEPVRLHLPGDRPSDAPTLDTWVAGLPDPQVPLGRIIAAIARAAIPLADRLAQGRLPGDPTAIVGRNDSGDAQKALDVAAHDYMIAALHDTGVASVLSEEAEEVIPLNPNGRFDVAIDPIDGSASIGIGAPLGLLFCVFPAGGFLRPGRDVVAAGYVSFGHSTDMAFGVGNGVVATTLDRQADVFRVTGTDLRLPPKATTIAYNASNVRHWAPGLQRYVADCVAGASGPRGRDFNMRWLAAAVGETHRILVRGGLFFYPADDREGYAQGRLRLIYEAVPIAWLIEQAGGAATDGRTPILDRIPGTLHEHTPLIFGDADEVAVLGRYLSETP